MFVRRWTNYYDGTAAWLQVPERCFVELPVPTHVDTILDLGCGNGRNFVPFEGKKHIGVDIVPENRIHWLVKPAVYLHSNVESLTRKLEAGLDMSRYLVTSSGTLMYLSQGEQERFFSACVANGCTAFIFQEYPPDSPKYPETNFKLRVSEFSSKAFRPGITTYYRL